MATLSVPSPGLGSASLGGSIHRPLSTHGLPKQPRTMSSERPHRFSAKSYPPPALVHTPMTPRSLGPMSPPPMSAKSFGTFIDSEPSTPAYSPRMDHGWDDSSVVLVRPMSSSSEPSSPTEPVWRMLQPLPAKAPTKPKPSSTIRGPKSHQQPRIDPTTRLRQSAFPKKTFVFLGTLAAIAYFFVEFKDWTNAVYAAYSPQDDGGRLASALHFYSNTDEIQHHLDYHIPDPAAPFKNPEAAKFIFDDQFERLCSGWMMTEKDAKRGYKGMPGVQMPITHGCRIRSNQPCEDFFSMGTSPGPGGEKLWNYWTIFDGHAGKLTALTLTWLLIPRVSSALSALASTASSPEIESALKNAFLAVDKSIMDRAKTAANWFPAANAVAFAALTPAFSGSCALLAAFDPQTSTLRVACTGDSRAVLGRWDPESATYTAMPLSVDQTGFNEAEVQRLNAAHPDEPNMLDPNSGRLLGIAVTRAFGDHRWKWDNESVKTAQHKFWGPAPRPGSKTPPYMTAEPEVTETKIVRAGGTVTAGKAEEDKKSDFLILASDGLWDRISSDHAVECVSRYISARARGSGSVRADPVLAASPPASYAMATTLDDGVTCDPDNEKEVDWKATPEFFAIEDENAAVCLARNALGGTRRGLLMGLMAIPRPWTRSAMDDTTVLVVFFDELGMDGQAKKGGVVAGEVEGKKKKWWWPL
ncbi:PTC1 Serine threonine protein phosphatase [Pyrenophora tritici-repentis]|nr:PTC1 Serine threonine protein phosphatase [Pyrenophora tritici-repentis]KAI1606178.1 PTC1 Serine threonine protein phosphatase [Pyrenophora tritici-repentis]